MEDARTLTSSQSLATTFQNFIESPEADITDIPFVRPEFFPTGNNKNIPVSIEDLVYGGKAAVVGTSAKYFDRQNELISSSKEAHGPRKDRGSSEGLNTHVLERTPPTDKSLVQKIKHFVRGPEEEVVPRKGHKPGWKLPKPQQEKVRLKKCQKRESKRQRTIRRASKRERERQFQSGRSLTHRNTEFPRKRR
ncbi:hypothetical protein O181_034720 [Austropuccinia psidii MF-1]|uniref:Uncharacterized protein n=1 Tax=Austropuccinia psidii MF-1 TaxID=1389203 RepID=A0A9Q3D5J0_9BASI|nr:hypothetical protein [Austropuccinia psidii MF-1]